MKGAWGVFEKFEFIVGDGDVVRFSVVLCRREGVCVCVLGPFNGQALCSTLGRLS